MNTLSKFKILLALPLFVITFAACDHDDYDTIAAPALEAGDCEYKKSGVVQTYAQSEMDRVVAIFENSTIGSHAVEVKKKEVYVSETVNGQPNRYGFQIVFSCDKAAVKYEESIEYDTKTTAETNLADRLSVLSAGRLIKVLQSNTKSYSYEECDECSRQDCDTCYDDNDEPYHCNCKTEYYDCNCSTDYDYAYWIEYLQVTAQLPDTTGRRAFINNEVSKVVNKARSNPITNKKACSNKGKLSMKELMKNSTVIPNSKKRFFEI